MFWVKHSPDARLRTAHNRLQAATEDIAMRARLLELQDVVHLFLSPLYVSPLISLLEIDMIAAIIVIAGRLKLSTYNWSL